MNRDIGLYPIVDSSHWLELLLPLGVKTVQLRIKDPCDSLDLEIQKSIALAKEYGASLFINDYWELAIRHGADGVHLGQSDVRSADLAAIREAGLLLGISTHCQAELDVALAIRPSYIAWGPIYPTSTKVMPFKPQGVLELLNLRRRLDYPLVAIGGINLENIKDVIETGVDGIAMISAITQASNPIKATQAFLQELTEPQKKPRKPSHDR